MCPPDRPDDRGLAFGSPGSEPRWTHSAKEGIGTAYHTSCRLWFTLSHGIVNEVYYPTIDQPNTRDFQFLISDGETFCHEEKRDLEHQIEYPEKHCLFFRLTNSDPAGGYRIIKDVLADPHRSVLLVRTKVEILQAALRPKLRLYALLAPHLNGGGLDNSGWLYDLGGRPLLHARRDHVHLVLACDTDFARRSVGYVGTSDGWQDLMDNFQMDWQFDSAEHGNIALFGEIDLSRGLEFTLALGFGGSKQSATTKLFTSLAQPFSEHREGYVRQWQRAAVDAENDLSAESSDGGSMYRLSRAILLAHEDKVFQGAMIASLSIPWGETKGDNDLGGYHLVWTRDLVQSATALLASGQIQTPLKALIWLACVQRQDGSFPQNSWIDGKAYWKGIQLDEVAAPMLLAWRLQRAGGLELFDPWTMIARASAFLILQGPVTQQERWEENAGYSPSTLATVIAGLVCAADFALSRGRQETADFILLYADWIEAHLEEWLVATRGELVPGCPRHYLRINPADPADPDPHADPNETIIQLANGGGQAPARNVVGGDFLHLVRLGIRDPKDPIVLDSLEVIDRVLKRDCPQGPAWRRYNGDGYGQQADGSAFDGAGVGRSWPLLTGERGHYELAAGNDPALFISAMEKFANDGGMLPEQVWDDADLPEAKMRRGCPTGAAMPLCWAHAEYISLLRSRHDGVPFDRIEPAWQRYGRKRDRVRKGVEIWTERHRLRLLTRGQKLRVITARPATVRWSIDRWAGMQDAVTERSELGLWFTDLPTAQLAGGTVVEFTFFWPEEGRWEGCNYEIVVGG